MLDSPENARAVGQKPPLAAVATDEERRGKAKRDLARALQSYVNKLDNPVARLGADATGVTEIFCAYARENYASRAVKFFEDMPPLAPDVLFEPGDLTEFRDLCGLPTIGDVFALAEGGVRVESLTLENGSLAWLLLEEPWGNWFRSQIRDCVRECVRAKREEYELRFPSSGAGDDPAGSVAIPSPGIEKGAIRMNRPSRHEIEKHAKDEFAVAQERIAIKHAKKWHSAMIELGQRGNIGGYVPTLTEVAAKHVRQQVIALADAYIKAFTLFGSCCDVEAERSLDAGAQQIAAGAISAVHGELDLISKRTKKHLDDPVGSIGREIEKSKRLALKKGVLKLERQRITAKRSESSLEPGNDSTGVFSQSEGVDELQVPSEDGVGGGAGIARGPIDAPPSKTLVTIGQLMGLVGQPLTPEWSAVFEAALSAPEDLEAHPDSRRLHKMLRIVGGMEASDADQFRSLLPVLLQELGLEIPAGVFPPIRRKGGRPQEEQTARIHAEWIKIGKPQRKAPALDRIADTLFADELKGILRASPQHRRVRERVRQALLRCEKRSAT
jgi:hypothetical protein